MLPALTIDGIENNVRHTLKHKPVDAIALVFASYAGERDGIVVEYLRRWSDYNFHSGEYIDLYHAGYARWCDSHPNYKEETKEKFNLTKIFGSEGYFYPELFHKIANFIKIKTRHAWGYAGQIDFLIFNVMPHENMLIDYSNPIALRTRDLIPGIYRDVDEFARAIFNLAQTKYGRFEPEDFKRDIAAIRLRKQAGLLARALGPKAVDLAAKLLVPGKV